MISSTFFLLLTIVPPNQKPVQAPASPQSCAASYFSRLVSSYGAQSSWKENKHLPEVTDAVLKEKIGDAGLVADGFNHWLVNESKNPQRVYVVQIGGITSDKRVFGPFPAPNCA